MKMYLHRPEMVKTRSEHKEAVYNPQWRGQPGCGLDYPAVGVDRMAVGVASPL